MNEKNSLGLNHCFLDLDDPIELFNIWMNEAKKSEPNDPNALTLATSNKDNYPSARMVLLDKKYLISVKSKVLDGRIFMTGKVDDPEDKLRLTKLAWETDGARSVRNDLKVKEQFNFKQSAKDILISSQLRTALIIDKEIKATNYQIDTYKNKIFIYGIAFTSEEKDMFNHSVSAVKQLNEVASKFEAS